ncbi:MAG: PhzF family phenazine biosynthesis isomerase [Acidobacteriota bacterium]
MKHRFVLVDVFADRPLGGNPLAVFPEAESIPEDRLQGVAREMDHAATAFLFPSSLSGALFRLRIFSREREIRFAGHPALGAHFVYATENRLPLEEPVTRVAHEGREGLFHVELLVERGRIGILRLRQRPAQIGPRLPADDVARVAKALGLDEESLQATNQPLRVASTGLPSLIVPVATLEALDRAAPRYGALREVTAPLDATIVYAFTKETRDAGASAHARAFDTIGASEVPGAGAAAGALAAYLVSQAAVPVSPVTSLVIEQGHALSRASSLYIEVHVGPEDPAASGKRETADGTERRLSTIREVILGGRVIAVGEGHLDF